LSCLPLSACPILISNSATASHPLHHHSGKHECCDDWRPRIVNIMQLRLAATKVVRINPWRVEGSTSIAAIAFASPTILIHSSGKHHTINIICLRIPSNGLYLLRFMFSIFVPFLAPISLLDRESQAASTFLCQLLNRALTKLVHDFLDILAFYNDRIEHRR
jgi:hypothetical protein